MPTEAPTQRAQQVFVPAVKSPRFQSLDEEHQAYWREIQGLVCRHCQQPIGQAVWAWVTHTTPPTGVHLGCQEDALLKEDLMLSEDGLVERAAKAKGLSVSEFRQQPKWWRHTTARAQAIKEGLI